MFLDHCKFILTTRFARVFDPAKGLAFLKQLMNDHKSLHEYEATVAKIIPCNEFQELMKDLPLLITAYEPSSDVKFTPEELAGWWKDHGVETGSWNKAAKLFMLLRPSSAVVERLFSVYKACVSDNMLGSKEDIQELRTQLSYDRCCGY